MTELDQSILNLISRGSLSVGAFWTADIAYLINQPTARVRASLLRLVRDGHVERVVTGYPSSWRARV